MAQNHKAMLHFFAITTIRNLLKVFWLFPIRQNRMLFISYSGTQYSCNPKYITRYLQEKYPHKFDMIFSVRAPEKWKDSTNIL